MAGAKDHEVTAIGMAANFRLRGDRLTWAARKQRSAICNRPIRNRIARQVELPQIALQVARIHRVDLLFAVGVRNNRGVDKPLLSSPGPSEARIFLSSDPVARSTM